MNRKFKVGDRVAVYGGLHNWGADCPELDGEKGTILSTNSVEFSNNLLVELDKPLNGTKKIHAHYKQCRRLKKVERQRLFITRHSINRLNDSNCISVLVSLSKVVESDVEFVEVRRKK